MQGRHLFSNEYATRQRAQRLKDGIAQEYVVFNCSPTFSHNWARSNSMPLSRFASVFLPPNCYTTLMQCGQHDINDELIFDDNDGYIFHDSRGFESGDEDELKTIQDFVRKKAEAERLRDRLHAIWFVLSLLV